jgi:hypothetical protein
MNESSVVIIFYHFKLSLCSSILFSIIVLSKWTHGISGEWSKPQVQYSADMFKGILLFERGRQITLDEVYSIYYTN